MYYKEIKESLQDIKSKLQVMAELEFKDKNRINNNILEELDKTITHVRRAILEINEVIKN